MADPRDDLRAFERSLEDLLGILEDPAAPAAALERASDRCAAAFEAVRLHAAPSRKQHERIAGLHALARQAAQRAFDDTETRVAQARDARRALANLRGQASAGGACDLEG